MPYRDLTPIVQKRTIPKIINSQGGGGGIIKPVGELSDEDLDQVAGRRLR